MARLRKSYKQEELDYAAYSQTLFLNDAMKDQFIQAVNSHIRIKRRQPNEILGSETSFRLLDGYGLCNLSHSAKEDIRQEIEFNTSDQDERVIVELCAIEAYNRMLVLFAKENMVIGADLRLRSGDAKTVQKPGL